MIENLTQGQSIVEGAIVEGAIVERETMYVFIFGNMFDTSTMIQSHGFKRLI